MLILDFRAGLISRNSTFGCFLNRQIGAGGGWGLEITEIFCFQVLFEWVAVGLVRVDIGVWEDCGLSWCGVLLLDFCEVASCLRHWILGLG